MDAQKRLISANRSANGRATGSACRGAYLGEPIFRDFQSGALVLAQRRLFDEFRRQLPQKLRRMTQRKLAVLLPCRAVAEVQRLHRSRHRRKLSAKLRQARAELEQMRSLLALCPDCQRPRDSQIVQRATEACAGGHPGAPGEESRGEWITYALGISVGGRAGEGAFTIQPTSNPATEVLTTEPMHQASASDSGIGITQKVPRPIEKPVPAPMINPYDRPAARDFGRTSHAQSRTKHTAERPGNHGISRVVKASRQSGDAARRCQRRHCQQRRTPITTSAPVLGSGIAGTACGSAGFRPVCTYCCWFSKTTAPLTGVTSW